MKKKCLIIIILIFISLILSFIYNIKNEQNELSCLGSCINHILLIGTIIEKYSSANNGYLPPSLKKAFSFFEVDETYFNLKCAFKDKAFIYYKSSIKIPNYGKIPRRIILSCPKLHILLKSLKVRVVLFSDGSHEIVSEEEFKLLKNRLENESSSRENKK